jgi:ABC-type transport system involved in multi-copper enzyme maturation permease subunit
MPAGSEARTGMNVRHVALVVAQEFRIRLRTGRWRWLLAVWVALLVVITALLDAGLRTGYGREEDDSLRGVPLFGFLMCFILGVMLVISPALTSQTINGDRERGTLATLQVTRLRPAEIATGKLLAAWGVGLAALALSVPFTGYAMVRGGIEVGRMLAVYAVVALLIGTICAVSQALSSLLARSITSALLSYVVTAGLAVGTLIAFGLALPLTAEEREVRYEGVNYTYVQTIQHTDQVWWLLAPNPFVILADAAPRVPPRATRDGLIVRYESYDPLSAIGWQVRQLRMPAEYTVDIVGDVPPFEYRYYDEEGNRIDPPDERVVWPYGLAFSVLLGGAALAVTTRRLRTPTDRLPRGIRVA